MTVRIFRGSERVEAVPAHDRGLAYGDGLFETMRAHAGLVPWWDAHWARLAAGAARLGLACPDPALVAGEARALLDGGDAVLKLILTRGEGARGYAPAAGHPPTWLLSRHRLPAPAGVLHVRWCRTRLASQPALAGLKHLNRLEQVLARAEWADAPHPERDAGEGLMRSIEGDVVCATAANLFVLREGRWSTPPVDRCGVAGVCRAWLLGASAASEARITVEEVDQADALVLCNAVRGILPVASLGDRTWSPHPMVTALQHRLAQANPAFQTPEDS